MIRARAECACSETTQTAATTGKVLFDEGQCTGVAIRNTIAKEQAVHPGHAPAILPVMPEVSTQPYVLRKGAAEDIFSTIAFGYDQSCQVAGNVYITIEIDAVHAVRRLIVIGNAISSAQDKLLFY